LIQHVDKMLVLDAGKVQHYGAAAEVLKAMLPKGQPAGGGAQVVAMPRAAGSAEHDVAQQLREERAS
jgi:ABC-type protease/lipase transport system fused ATPase/permease subunit